MVDVCTFVAIKSGRRVLFFSFLVAVDDSLQVTIVVHMVLLLLLQFNASPDNDPPPQRYLKHTVLLLNPQG